MIGLVVGLPSAVTPQTQVVSLRMEAEILSKSLGKRVTVEKSIANKLVFVYSGATETNGILNAVAIAAHASVVKSDDGFTIERTKKDRDNLLQNQIRYRTSLVNEQISSIGDFRAGKLAHGSLADAYKSYLTERQNASNLFIEGRGPSPKGYFAEQLLPSETLLESLIQRIGASKLASVPIGETRIFEDFPSDGADSLSAYTDLVSRYVADSSLLLGETLPRSMDGKTSYVGKPGVAPSKIRLKATSGSSSLVIEMEGYDDLGNLIVSSAFATKEHEPPEAPGTVAHRWMADSHSNWFASSDSAESVISDLHLRATDAVPKWRLNSDLVEPLNLFASQILDGLASENQSSATVIDVSDTLWDLAIICHQDRRMCVTALKEILCQCYGFEQVNSEGATVWRPRFPATWEADVADRKVLAKASRDILDNSQDLLRVLSQAFHETSAQWNPFVEQWFNSIIWHTDRNAGPALQEPIYRLLGALSDETWDQLNAGKTIALGDLVSQPDLWSPIANDFLLVTGEQGSDLQKHSNELYDRWPLTSTRLSFASETHPVIRTWMKGEDPTVWRGLDSLAYVGPEQAVTFHISGEDWGRPEFETMMGSGRLFRYGNEVDRIIDFTLPHGLHSRFKCCAGFRDVSDPVEYQDLPGELKDKIWAETKKLWDSSNASLRPTQPLPVTNPVSKPR